jgi:cytochrome b6-f complex iron-sulfur subunit
VGATRRQVLNWVLGAASGTLLGTLLFPILRYVMPPAESDESADAVTVAKVADFPPNSGKVVRFGNQPAIVVRLPSGEFRAFSAVCTHLDCIVQYRKDREVIWCACHNGTYDLSGRNIAGPPPRPLEAYDVAVRGDDVVLSHKST